MGWGGRARGREGREQIQEITLSEDEKSIFLGGGRGRGRGGLMQKTYNDKKE